MGLPPWGLAQETKRRTQYLKALHSTYVCRAGTAQYALLLYRHEEVAEKLSG